MHTMDVVETEEVSAALNAAVIDDKLRRRLLSQMDLLRSLRRDIKQMAIAVGVVGASGSVQPTVEEILTKIKETVDGWTAEARACGSKL